MTDSSGRRAARRPFGELRARWAQFVRLARKRIAAQKAHNENKKRKKDT